MKRNALMGSFALVSVIALSACGGREADDTAAAPADTEAAAPADTAADTSAADVAPVAFADLTADAAAGEQVFAVCRTCHLVEEGQNRVGPSLYGIVGRAAGTVEGFNYTDANANSGITWTPEELFSYLEDPQAAIPGTRMAFPGVKDAQDRANLVAYLQTVSE